MKFILGLSAGLLFAVVIISCGSKNDGSSSSTSSDPNPEPKTEEVQKDKSTNRKGKLVYKQYCVICHGADGKLGISGATDLSVSLVSIEERIDQVTNGKGLMTPFKDILSAEQIQAVVSYLDELRQ